MASARIVTSEPEVELTLSWREAVVLRSLFNHIGGSSTGPRGFINNIAGALYNVGIEEEDTTIRFEASLPDSLYMK